MKYIYNDDNPSEIPCLTPSVEGDGNKCGLECCRSSTFSDEDSGISKRIKEIFNELFKNEQDIITRLEQRLNNMTPGGGIPGPPGPPGAPGTPGSDGTGIPASNQYPNLICPNEPGGICSPGQTRCNDDGFCEGFSLISLQDKIDMQKRFKDLNNNSYKANNLMNKLENYLLNSLK